MKLPRINAQTPPPIQRAVIPADTRAQDIGALTRTGDQAMWRAVSQAGEALKDVGQTLFAINQDKRAADIDLKYSKFTQDLEFRDTTQEDTLINQANITSAEQQSAALKEISANRQNWITERINFEKDPKARQLMKIYANRSYPEFDKRMLGVTSAKWVGYQVAERKKLIDALAVNGEYEAANKEVDKITGTLITARDGENWKRDIEQQKILLAIRNAGSTLLPEDEKIASDTIENSDVFTTEEEKISLRSRLTTTINLAKQQNELLMKQQDDEIGEGFLKLLINKLDPSEEQLTFEMINNSDLSFGAKDKWFTKLQVFDNYSEEELEEAFRDKGTVLADIHQRVADNKITDEQIRNTVGKGLSPTTAEAIIRDKEIWNQHEYKETEQLFKRIFGWSSELGFEDDMSSFLYEKALREWKAQVKKQDVKGEEIIELGRAIARPYFIEHLKATMTMEDIPRMVELALGEEEIKEESLPEETPLIEEESYEVGETRPDEEGQLWEYMGDNKWQKKSKKK